ncbi:GNAT family N-acetyltransferase [Oceanobacillus alkalisoli]|uniref:GNAT family N-acetyltransferase n=1 Tax=Oceanobacillus alkalisoli TaxID=2925113 RepID=UPI001EE3F6B0|nr:GNAT family N-acetyltransferase [Oceanobacillus alkalisoli]
MKGTYTHVALVNGKVVGTIGGGMTGPDVSEIYVFYVDDNYRYKGIGAKLLKAFTKKHIERGAKKQYVSVQEGNDLVSLSTRRGALHSKNKLGATGGELVKVYLPMARVDRQSFVSVLSLSL